MLKPDSKPSAEYADIAIIIATYKRPHLITRALDSVAAQSLRPKEVYVVDDCSGDNTADVVRGWSQQHGWPIHYIGLTQNGGVGAARNHALRQTQCRYIGFLDSDDAYLPHALACLLEPLEQYPDASVSFADAAIIDDTNDDQDLLMSRALSRAHACAQVNDRVYRLIDAQATLLLTSMIPTCAALFRRDAAEHIGFMPAYRHGEDWLFWLLMTQRGDFLCQFTPVAHVHRQGDNLTGTRHAASTATHILRAHLALASGEIALPLRPQDERRLTTAIQQQTAHWRYHHSRKGLRHYLKALRSAEGRATGAVLHHLRADPKAVLRALMHIKET